MRDADAAGASAAANGATEAKTINFYGNSLGEDAQKAAWQAVLDGYSGESGVNVAPVIYPYDQAATQLALTGRSGKLMGVGQAGPWQVLTPMDVLADLTDLADGLGIPQGVLDAYTIDGKLFVLPLTAAGIGIIIERRDRQERRHQVGHDDRAVRHRAREDQVAGLEPHPLRGGDEEPRPEGRRPLDVGLRQRGRDRRLRVHHRRRRERRGDHLVQVAPGRRPDPGERRPQRRPHPVRERPHRALRRRAARLHVREDQRRRAEHHRQHRRDRPPDRQRQRRRTTGHGAAACSPRPARASSPAASSSPTPRRTSTLRPRSTSSRPSHPRRRPWPTRSRRSPRTGSRRRSAPRSPSTRAAPPGTGCPSPPRSTPRSARASRTSSPARSTCSPGSTTLKKEVQDLLDANA